MAWVGDDFQRPLDDFGQIQAEAIGEALASRPVQRILSSPAVRCVDTVVPLGRALGLRVETADELAEGSSVGDAFDLLRSLASAEGDCVLCSHGDVIPGLIWVLAQYGLDIPELGRCKKGSIWELEVSEGRVSSAPPTAIRAPSAPPELRSTPVPLRSVSSLHLVAARAGNSLPDDLGTGIERGRREPERVEMLDGLQRSGGA